MRKNLKALLKYFGILLFFAICMTMLSRGVQAQAGTSDMRLNVSEVSIARDASFRLRAYNVPTKAKLLFRSSDTSVAIVDNRGDITGISNGECVITATVIENGSASATLQCNVLIGPAAISIKLTKTELVMKIGMKKTLKTIVSPLNTVEKPVFYSSDKLVASVTSIGRVKAKDVGVVDIVAFLKNGQSAECKVYVLSDEDYLRYTESGTLEGIIPDYVPVDIDESDDPENDDTEVNPEEKDTETEEELPEATATPTPVPTTSPVTLSSPTSKTVSSNGK